MGTPRTISPASPPELAAQRNARLVQLLIVLVWLRVIVPGWIIVLDFGRLAMARPGAGGASSPLAEQAGTALSAGVCVVALLLIARNLQAVPAQHIGWLFAFLAPAGVLFASDLVNHSVPGGLTLAAYPLVGFALWLASPPATVLAANGVITVLVAAGSLLWGLVAPTVATLDTVVGGKALFRGLLAGPFVHPNLLGMALALGLPFVFMLRRRWVRWVGVVVVGAALAWATARTSQGAAVAVLVTYLVLRFSPGRVPLTAKAVALAGAALVVCVPLLVTDTAAFTERGRIWMRSITYWQEQPVLGWGSAWFTRLTQQVNDVGRWAFHGHNLFVNTLTTAGVLGVAALAVLLVLAARRAGQLARAGVPAAFMFVVAVLFVFWLEAAFRLPNVDGGLLWLPLAVIMFARVERSDPGVVEQVHWGRRDTQRRVARQVIRSS